MWKRCVESIWWRWTRTRNESVFESKMLQMRLVNGKWFDKLESRKRERARDSKLGEWAKNGGKTAPIWTKWRLNMYSLTERHPKQSLGLLLFFFYHVGRILDRCGECIGVGGVEPIQVATENRPRSSQSRTWTTHTHSEKDDDDASKQKRPTKKEKRCIQLEDEHELRVKRNELDQTGSGAPTTAAKRRRRRRKATENEPNSEWNTCRAKRKRPRAVQVHERSTDQKRFVRK